MKRGDDTHRQHTNETAGLAYKSLNFFIQVSARFFAFISEKQIYINMDGDTPPAAVLSKFVKPV